MILKVISNHSKLVTKFYRKYENKDYANTRGFTLVLDRQFSGGFGGGIDYTWMIAEGTYSNPQDAYFDAQELIDNIILEKKRLTEKKRKK